MHAQHRMHMQGYILQLPSARAALGMRLPQLKPASAAEVEAQQAQQQRPQMVSQASGGEQPGAQKMARGRAIDPAKLMNVPTEIRKIAARSTDAHAMLLKVSLYSQHCKVDLQEV